MPYGYVSGPELDRRWVACAASDHYAGGSAVLAAFRDRVDAGLLDFMSGTGRLQAPGGGSRARAAENW